MKTILAVLVSLTAVASAQPAPSPSDAPPPCNQPCTIQPGGQIPVVVAAPQAAPAPAPTTIVVQAQPAVAPAATGLAPAPTLSTDADADDGSWHAPVGRRFSHGFRLGGMVISNYDKMTRDNNTKSLKDEFGLKSPFMMLLGYEAFYRIVGHSWLNVLMVGNVTVAGLEQSKFIPGASGLLGFEFNRSFQLGVGVNVIPDSVAPSHAVIAAGWTPMAGAIQVPIHFFFMPDPDGNHRTGATIGMNW
ncbi:MAG: hypothetical protein JO257_10700 [Deltaproteobacteria bacterium]|nr:hypothetical protein [Deltaproteobacteria bacterium]